MVGCAPADAPLDFASALAIGSGDVDAGVVVSAIPAAAAGVVVFVVFGGCSAAGAGGVDVVAAAPLFAGDAPASLFVGGAWRYLNVQCTLQKFRLKTGRNR